MFQVVIDRALLSLIGILRPAMPPFRELIVAEPVPLPPGAGHFAVGVTELRYSVGRAAAEPYERLDDLLSMLCVVHPYGPPSPLLVKDFHRSSKCSYLLGKIHETFNGETGRVHRPLEHEE